MNYDLLFNNQTTQFFDEVCENWYARLNNLKEFYANNPNNKKVLILIEEMINRMMILSKLAIKINKPVPKENYKIGFVFPFGIASIKESGAEFIKGRSISHFIPNRIYK